jgi:ABC-type phosphate/phosphonate transport system ATPase subunit
LEASAAKLQVRHLSKVFLYQEKSVVAFEDINLHLQANELVCLVGLRGAANRRC